MSVSSVGGSSGAYSYLQSLLQQQSGSEKGAARPVDPLEMLLQAFYPNGVDKAATSTSPAATGSQSSGLGASPFTPDTMANLLAIQEQQGAGGGSRLSARVQSLVGQFDADANGQISKSEFETAFGPNADTSKVDGLFSALDADGDGSVSQSELTSAAQQSRANHHHHHMRSGGSGQGAGLLDTLMSATQGATTQTSSNADGSTTTTISYADGSKITMTVPAPSAAGSSDSGVGNQSSSHNLLEQLIRLQAQSLTPSAS